MAEALDPGFEKDLQTRFPDLWHISKVFPEIGELMRRALEGDGESGGSWEPAYFDAQLRQTEWFRSRSDAKRRWDIESERDPGQAERRRETRTNTISDRASTWGITIPPNELATIVEQSLAWDYTDAELDDLIASYGEGGGVRGGTAGASAQEIIALGREYLHTIPQADAERFALKILQGEMTMDGVKANLASQAGQAFPQFADQISSGYSIADATASMRGHVSQILDIDPMQIDFNDDRWTDLIDHVDEQGQRRMMTRSEAGRWARKQTDYRNTDQSRQIVAGLLQSVGQTMGKIK